MFGQIRRGLRLAAPLVMACAVGTASAADTVTRTDWQMHEGQGKSAYGGNLNPGANGIGMEPWFNPSKVPAADDSGWRPAPNGQTIALVSTSSLDQAECKKAVDYTYFQTIVNVPATVNVTQFNLSVKGMDDMVRVSIYNSQNRNGSVIDGSYVRRGQPEMKTADLKSLLVKGEKNRLVITLMDNCGTANNLEEAKIQLNGVEPVVMASPPAAVADTNVFPDGYFKLTTQFREGKNECLEGNQKAGSRDGAAFMDSCQNVSGQLWKATPAGNGYFKLTTQFREGNNECLEGNQKAGSMNGAAFMDSCQNVSGQLWKATSAGNGYFKLTTQFREGNNECLEGNQKAGSMNGVAFMDSCQNVSGQLWKAMK